MLAYEQKIELLTTKDAYYDDDSKNKSQNDECSSISSDDSDNDSMNDFIVHDETSPENQFESGILKTLLNKEETDNAHINNITIHQIKTTIDNATQALEPPQLKFYSSAYGSCPLYQVDEGLRLVPIPHPFLYRYRGEELKNLNRLEYYSTIAIEKDQRTDNTNDDSSNTTNH